MRTREDPREILVTIAHPHGDIELTLAEWMQTGPGRRELLRPSSPRRQRTGEPLPRSVIPFAYRNTALGRRLIKVGLMRDPWAGKS